MSRYLRPHDQEDEAARLARRSRGVVAVWSDGSVLWRRSPTEVPAVAFAAEAPILIPCLLPDRAARSRYTAAIREWWRRDRFNPHVLE